MSSIYLRRGTASQWNTSNPTLAAGEPGFETDTGILKIGDGSTAWNSLSVYTGSAAALLAKLITVDGSGSGLDADTVDGSHASDFALSSDLSDHLSDTTAHDASDIVFTPYGDISETEVQSAIEFLIDHIDTENEIQPFKSAVKVASVGNLTLSGDQTIDGVAVSDPDRVLVKNQLDASENGIYMVGSSTWARVEDADESWDFSGGLVVTVREGDVNADSVWLYTGNVPTVGVSDIDFVKVSYHEQDVVDLIDAHVIEDPAHSSSVISFDDSGLIVVSGSDVQAALESLDAAVGGIDLSEYLPLAGGEMDTSSVVTFGEWPGTAWHDSVQPISFSEDPTLVFPIGGGVLLGIFATANHFVLARSADGGSTWKAYTSWDYITGQTAVALYRFLNDGDFDTGIVNYDNLGLGSGFADRIGVGLGTDFTAVGTLDNASTSQIRWWFGVAGGHHLVPGIDLAYDLGESSRRVNEVFAGTGTFSSDVTVGGVSVSLSDHDHDGVYEAVGVAAGLVDDLSGVSDASTARTNLGLGDLAVLDEVAVSDIDASGTADSTTFLRGDGSWSAPAGGSGSFDLAQQIAFGG